MIVGETMLGTIPSRWSPVKPEGSRRVIQGVEALELQFRG
jgi:hypothetical protein